MESSSDETGGESAPDTNGEQPAGPERDSAGEPPVASDHPSADGQPAEPGPDRADERRAAPATRSDEEPSGAVLITGICGRLGQRLARKLHRETRVAGIDRRPFPHRPKDIVHHELDIRRKKTRDLFRAGRFRAVVHLGILHDPRASPEEHHSWNVLASAKLLEYVERYRVPKLVVLSSANVYGPRPGNPQFLTEEAPLLGGATFSEIRDLVEVDMLAQSFFWRNPDVETVVLRPVHILGTVHNAASNYLRREWVPTLAGFDPMIQVVHEDDVVDALIRALEPGIRGIFNLAGPGALPLSKILALVDMPAVPVPHVVAKSVLRRLWNLRIADFPAAELDHIRFVCMVDDRRARSKLGWAPKRSLEETLLAVRNA